MAYNLDNSGISIFGNEKLGKIFDELKPTTQNQIIKGGFKKAGNIILQQVKINFNNKVNDKGSLNLKQYLKNEPMKSKIGEKIGYTGKNAYLIRFLNYGTQSRFYKKNSKNHFTGKLIAGNFFTDAVNSKKAEAIDAIQDCIIESFDKIIMRNGGKK